MTKKIKIYAGFLLGLFLFTKASAENTDLPPLSAESELISNRAMLIIDYQVLSVVGDNPIDLIGLHIFKKIGNSLYFGPGMSGPLVQGEYGGFMTADLTGHLQHHLTSQLFTTAGLSLGGGGGGRSVESSKVLSGTGGFFKSYVGLGFDFGEFSIGVNLAKMKFSQSAIDSTQANVFLEIPYTYTTGKFTRHDHQLSFADTIDVAEENTEKMISLVLDSYRQLNPQGSYKGNFNVADLQYGQYFSRDNYWFTSLGVGYSGLPVYNQILGGVGKRIQLLPRLNVYGQMGIGSGGYAPEIIDTGAGLLFNPRLVAEYALTTDLGLTISAGYLVATTGSSKNQSFGMGLTQKFAFDNLKTGSNDGSGLLTYHSYRVGLFHQVNSGLRFNNKHYSQLTMIGTQIDTIIDGHWYIPIQASMAYNAYIGYPGYGEILAGIGLQSQTTPGENWQVFCELMGGTNVVGLANKASFGLRYSLSDQTSLQLAAGRIEAKSSTNKDFSANSLSVTLNYLFSIPGQ